MRSIDRRITVVGGTRARVTVAAVVVAGGLGLVASPAGGAPAEEASAPVFRVADVFGGQPPRPVGSSTLVRTDNGVTATLKTTGLTPGHAVTLWAVVFNDPDGCVTGTPVSSCGHADAHAGRGGVSPNHAAGQIVDEDGAASFGAHLRVGDTSRALAGPGLTNPRGAEVILVVKTHGPTIPGMVPDQLHTFGGGCANQSDAPPGTPPELLGTPGPNDCDEIQISAQRPAW